MGKPRSPLRAAAHAWYTTPLTLAACCLASTLACQRLLAATGPASPPPTGSHLTLSRLAIAFEPNLGQVPGATRFLARGPGYTLHLGAGGAVLTGHTSGRTDDGRFALRMMFEGGRHEAPIDGEELLPGKSHYLLGRDPRGWLTKVPRYEKVKYREVFPGVDVVFYGNPHQLEYDFVVAPGADPGAIRLALEGATAARLDTAGDLVMSVGKGEIRLGRPIVYQWVDGSRHPIDGAYVLEPTPDDAPKLTVSFTVADYDSDLPLIVDPVVTYGSYFGGAGRDDGHAIALDAAGNLYIAGETRTDEFDTPPFPLFPLAPAVPADSTLDGTIDGFIAKLSPDGNTLLYSTYVGGSGDERVHALAVDGAGNAHITGRTASTDFPTHSPNAQPPYQPVNANSFDAFLLKLNASGTGYVYSTYIGGSAFDEGFDVATDDFGNAYVLGYTNSNDLGTTEDAYQSEFAGGVSDAFVGKFAGDGTVQYVTYLGGSGDESNEDFGIAANASQQAFVTGRTTSIEFPTTPGVMAEVKGNNSGFLSKLAADGSALTWSTYIPRSGLDLAVNTLGESFVVDSANVSRIAADASFALYTTPLADGKRIVLDADDNAHVMGDNGATFITKLDSVGAVEYSEVVGGDAGGVAVDTCPNVYITGSTTSDNFSTTSGAPFESRQGAKDAFVARYSEASFAAAYVTNVNDDSVTVIDPATREVLHTITAGVGDTPWGVANSPSGDRVYVTNFRDDTVSVIDTTLDPPEVVAIVPVGRRPIGVAVSPDGAYAYIANTNPAPAGTQPGGHTVSVIDTASNTLLDTVNLGFADANVPFGIAASPLGDAVYVSNKQGGQVNVITVSGSNFDMTDTVNLGPGAAPKGIAVHPDGTKGYVACAASNVTPGDPGLAVIDVANNNAVSFVPLPGKPYGVAVHPDGTRVYVSDSSTTVGRVWVLDVESTPATLDKTLDLGSQLAGIDVSPEGLHVLVAAVSSDEVRFIDANGDAVIPSTAATDDAPVAFGEFIAGPLSAAGCPPATATQGAMADMSIVRERPNESQGGHHSIDVQSSGRGIVSFDLSEVRRAPSRVDLVMNLIEPTSGWRPSSRPISVQRLLAEPVEHARLPRGRAAISSNAPASRRPGAGAGTIGPRDHRVDQDVRAGSTWKCEVDRNVANKRRDCHVSWHGGARAAAVPAGKGVVHVDGMTGVVAWDVTADMRKALHEGQAKVHWLIRSVGRQRSGRASYYSREGAASVGDIGLGPRLVLHFEPLVVAH